MSKKLEELSKLNFWDAIKVLYPKSFSFFEKWIDEYKADNGWKGLFNDQSWRADQAAAIHSVPPKFHELPFAMQFGIFTQFLADQGDGQEEFIKDFKNVSLEVFKEMEKSL